MADLPTKGQQTLKPVDSYRSIYQNQNPVDISKPKSKELSATVTGTVKCEPITQSCRADAEIKSNRHNGNSGPYIGGHAEASMGSRSSEFGGKIGWRWNW